VKGLKYTQSRRTCIFTDGLTLYSISKLLTFGLSESSALQVVHGSLVALFYNSVTKTQSQSHNYRNITYIRESGICSETGTELAFSGNGQKKLR
jgi:hypothetical protein